MSIGTKAINATKNILSRTAYSAAITYNESPTTQQIFPETEEKTIECRDYGEIPGPKELPLIGNSWRFAPFIGQYKIHELDKVMWSLYQDYGPIVKVAGLIGHPDLLFVFNGDDIQRVFRREEVLPHRPSMPSLHYYKQVLRKSFFGDTAGVIGVHGKKWDDFRSQVQQIMLQPSTARKYVGPLNEIADDFMDRIDEMKDINNELPGDFLNELYKWALESVCRFSLDTRLGCLDVRKDSTESNEAQQIIKSINTFFWNVAEVELRMPIWRIYQNQTFKDYIGALDDFRILCLKHIEKAMERMEKRDLEDPNYIKEQDQRNEEDISIVERIIKKTGNPKIAAILALDLLLVGVDTTSVAVTSTIYQLTQNQSIQLQLYNELKSILPNKDTPITNQHLQNTQLLKACIKETLRMYPVILGNGRSLQSDAIISGYKVPKGTHVIFPHYVVSNLAEYFPQPQEFRPQRWIKNNTKETCIHNSINNNGNQRIHPFVSLPFGYGRRTCIGRRFAEIEMQILLAKIFRKYRVEYNYGKLTYKVSPTYIPKEPLKFKLIEREN